MMSGKLGAGIDVAGAVRRKPDPFTGFGGPAAGPYAGGTLPFMDCCDGGVPVTGASCGGACEAGVVPVPSDGAVCPW